MAFPHPFRAACNLGVGLAAVVWLAAACAGPVQVQEVQAPPQGEADEQAEVKRRIARVMAARERMTWVTIEDEGHVFRAVYDDGADRWLQLWHSPRCPCHGKKDARPGAWAVGE